MPSAFETPFIKAVLGFLSSYETPAEDKAAVFSMAFLYAYDIRYLDDAEKLGVPTRYREMYLYVGMSCVVETVSELTCFGTIFQKDGK